MLDCWLRSAKKLPLRTLICGGVSSPRCPIVTPSPAAPQWTLHDQRSWMENSVVAADHRKKSLCIF